VTQSQEPAVESHAPENASGQPGLVTPADPGEVVHRVEPDQGVAPAAAEGRSPTTVSEAVSPKRRIPIGSQRPGSTATASTIGQRIPLVVPAVAPANAPAASPVATAFPTEVTPLVDRAGEALQRHRTARHRGGARPTAAVQGRSGDQEAIQPADHGAVAREGRPPVERSGGKRVSVPNLRAPLDDELAEEFEKALGGLEVESLLDASVPTKAEVALDPGARVTGTVLRLSGDTAFIDLGGRRQGALKLLALPPEEMPEIGQMLDVSVGSFNDEDGLYEVAPANRAVTVEDYSQIEAGMIVNGRVTAANKGGLEVDVAGLRGFMPASLVSTWRIENLEEMVGQTLECLVSEIVPSARRLVLSRRAVLERQAADAKAAMLESLEPGDMFDGIVRTVRDFGGFVDIGNGVEGLVHVSQLSWDRVASATDVLQPGQAIRVVVKKIDRETGRISLSARDTVESPWRRAASTYHIGATVRGIVSRIAQFGAFVRLEPGIEGLVHVSELAHRHLRSVADAVREGQEVECRVLSVDPDDQRMSLSIKALAATSPAPEDETGDSARGAGAAENGPAPPAAADRKGTSPTAPLKGGTGSGRTGERFGLKW